MQKFEFLWQQLLGELAMSWRERKKERKKREQNAIYSGHLRFCLQPKGSARTLLGPIYDYACIMYSMLKYIKDLLRLGSSFLQTDG